MSTGVRILPRDSTGYIYDDCYVTYQIARAMNERYAELYPHFREQLVANARALNKLHLNRILRQAIYAKDPGQWSKLDRWYFDNLPRGERKRWRQFLDAPAPEYKTQLAR